MLTICRAKHLAQTAKGAVLCRATRESDVILGTRCLKVQHQGVEGYLYTELLPVLTTCATDIIIGEDYSLVIEEMQDEIDCKLLYMPGFR